MPARRPALHVKFSAQPTVSHLHRDNVMLAYRSISVTWQKLGHWKNASSEYQKEYVGETSARMILKQNLSLKTLSVSGTLISSSSNIDQWLEVVLATAKPSTRVLLVWKKSETCQEVSFSFLAMCAFHINCHIYIYHFRWTGYDCLKCGTLFTK